MKRNILPQTAYRASIGKRLRRRRQALGLTLDQVACRVGATHALIYFIEKGQRGMSIDTLFALSRALEVTPGWFFRGTK